jgi:hypothetical protein
MNPEHIAWSRKTFDSLNEGGVWGIPRSGLMFRRRGDTLVLFEAMPWSEGMPITGTQLIEQQESDYRAVKRHFEAAGITVIREKKRHAP